MALTTNGLTNGGVTQHYRFQYDDSLQHGASNPEPARTNHVIAACENDFNLMSGWFGNIPLDVDFTIPVNVTQNDGGAGWSKSGRSLTVTINPASADSLFVRYLLVSEMVEQWMRAQGRGWFGQNTEGSGGEGLSRFLAAQFLAFNGVGTIPARFDNSNAWLGTARQDFVNHLNPTDDGPDAATGCALLFIYYLFTELGFSIERIVAAGGSTLAAVYKNLTNDTADPFPAFKHLLDQAYPGTQTISGLNLDNPFPLLRENSVIYAIETTSGGGRLRWNRHLGRDHGTFSWDDFKTVGTGWGEFLDVFAGPNGVIYAIEQEVPANASGGRLRWIRHVGQGNGTFSWSDWKIVGTGWSAFKQVFAAPGGVIYGIEKAVPASVDASGHFTPASGGRLRWTRHLGQNNGAFSWLDWKTVGTGWSDFKQVFAGENGVIYAIETTAAGGRLRWARHLGQADGTFSWEDWKTVGTGWGELKHVFAAGDGVIYAVETTAGGGRLRWARHLGRANGAFAWEGPTTVGTGWGEFKLVFAPGR